MVPRVNTNPTVIFSRRGMKVFRRSVIGSNANIRSVIKVIISWVYVRPKVCALEVQ
jgi:hypothetical protein